MFFEQYFFLMKNYISINIIYLVAKSRISQKEFGEMFDLKQSIIGQYARNVSTPKVETIQRICQYFEITIDDFINKELEKLEKEKKYLVNDPGETYGRSKYELLLEQALDDKNKIIAALEEKIGIKNKSVG